MLKYLNLASFPNIYMKWIQPGFNKVIFQITPFNQPHPFKAVLHYGQCHPALKGVAGDVSECFMSWAEEQRPPVMALTPRWHARPRCGPREAGSHAGRWRWPAGTAGWALGTWLSWSGWLPKVPGPAGKGRQLVREGSAQGTSGIWTSEAQDVAMTSLGHCRPKRQGETAKVPLGLSGIILVGRGCTTTHILK